MPPVSVQASGDADDSDGSQPVLQGFHEDRVPQVTPQYSGGLGGPAQPSPSPFNSRTPLPQACQQLDCTTPNLAHHHYSSTGQLLTWIPGIILLLRFQLIVPKCIG